MNLYKAVRRRRSLVASDTTEECQKYLSLGSYSDTHFLHALTSCIILSYEGRLFEWKTTTIGTKKKYTHKKTSHGICKGMQQRPGFTATAVN